MSRYEGYFQPWELRIAKSLVDSFLKKHDGLAQDEFEDILQECLFHWTSVRGRYNPQRGASIETLMWKVIRRKLAQIWRAMEADKRKVSQQTVSLNEPLKQEDDSATHLDRLTSQPREESGHEEQVCLKIDLAKTLRRLPPKQRELCTYLGNEDMSILEISQKLQISRSTIYDEIKRIRKFFYDNELEEYLKKR